MATLYIVIILIFRVVQAIFNKRSSNHIDNIYLLTKFIAVEMLASAVLSIASVIIDGAYSRCSMLAFVLASLSGLSIFLCLAFSMYAMKNGSMTSLSMFSNAGLLVPLVAGVFFFNQPISALQWYGVLLFFASAYLLMVTDKNTSVNFNPKVILLWIGALLANGATMLTQQLFTALCPDVSVTFFTLISFSVVSLFGCLTLAYMRLCNNKEEKASKLSADLLICAFSLALALFVINLLATTLTTMLPPVILFTILSGGAMIINALVGVIMYNEKLTPRKLLAVVIGIVSLVIVKVF